MLEANNAQRPIVQLTRTGVRADATQFARLREEFAEKHCVVLPHLFEPKLLEFIMARLARATFTPATYPAQEAPEQMASEFAKDEIVKGDEVALHLIHLLLNSAKLFQIVQQLTGCSPIGSFVGRVYRVAPGTDYHLDWHSDEVGEGRLIGLSINLSPAVYRGGLFQLRELKTRRRLAEVAHARPGDAHIFRIAPALQHRLTRLEGQVARLAAAGWFIAGTDAATQLKRLWSKTESGEPLRP